MFGKLLHYEFRKCRSSKIMLLGITTVLELLFLIGILSKDENVLAISVVLLTITAIVGVIGLGIESVITLHRDMNTRQGYMLFMTPNSSLKILGAKVLENGLSMLLAAVFFGALGFLDVSLLFSYFGELDRLWQILSEMMEQFIPTLELNWGTAAVLILDMLCSWLAMVNMGYLADVLASSVLRGKKAGGFVAFLLFLALSFLMGWLQQTLVPETLPIIQRQIWFSVVALACAAGMYFLTAYVMERKLSV